MSANYTTNVGDYLIVQIIGCVRDYIAEVIQSDPLQVKITESGKYSKFEEDSIIIVPYETEQFQGDCLNNTNIFLETTYKEGRKVFSGLKSLGITDGELHPIYPA